jgi:uncharacterized membrane protein YfhO
VVLSESGPGGDAGRAAPNDAGASDLAVVTDAPTAIELTVEAERPGYVVVADALQSGWVATVDGTDVPLVEADHAGVAVAVPAGLHEVELRYRPRGRSLGLALSTLTVVGMLVALVWERRRHRQADR